MSRSMPRLCLMFVLFALFLGCVHAAPSVERPFTIVAFGDSTTAPRTVKEQPLRVYADVLRDELGDASWSVHVINSGVGGDNTGGALARFETDVLQHEPDMVILQFGLNDGFVDVHKGKTEPRVALSAYRDNLDHMVKTLRDKNVAVIIMTPNPMFWTNYHRENFGKPPYLPDERMGRNVLNKDYAEAARSVSRKHKIPLIDVYRRYLDYDRMAGQNAEDLFLDGIHPNTEGQAMVADWLLSQLFTDFDASGARRKLPRSYSIPLIDLADQTHRQVLVDREKDQYLGHPTTALLEDGKTMICVYPKGHGKGGIVMKRSVDGGLTWSDRLPTPENWATSKEVPTLHRVVDPQGVKRLILFSGLYPVRMSVSEDDGLTWSPLEAIGDFGGIVTMGDVERLANGDYMAFFHDDGRFFRADTDRENPSVMQVYSTRSKDGGLTWEEPVTVVTHPTAHLCEPGVVRSPDGKQLAMLLRENRRRYNGFITFSDDEGVTWSRPRQMPAALTGDRHTAVYAPDGRLFISFRDTTLESPTKGDWVGWVGSYDDLVAGAEGQYRVRLMDNQKGADCAYPGVELLPDGTIVTTTYGHWTAKEAPYIMSVRFTLEELDGLATKKNRGRK
jgi:lysophospholipase L1-like esterase